MDAECFRRALAEDETLAALVESGTPSGPLLDLARHVHAEALELLASRREALALERAIAMSEQALAEVVEHKRRLRVLSPEVACARGCSRRVMGGSCSDHEAGCWPASWLRDWRPDPRIEHGGTRGSDRSVSLPRRAAAARRASGLPRLGHGPGIG